MLYLILFQGISLSLGQSKRVLKAKVLERRRNPSDLREVCEAVEEELPAEEVEVILATGTNASAACE